MDIYNNLGAGQEGLYLYLARQTVPRLRNIILLVFCGQNIRDESLWYVRYIYNYMSTNQGSPTKRNAPCDYTYTGSSGKMKLNWRFPRHLRGLLTKQTLPNGMGLETQSSNWLHAG
jgi:hypothetical protein